MRAAGTACGSNPIPIVVPCHRVLRIGGALGGYGGGLPMKESLLELEGSLPSVQKTKAGPPAGRSAVGMRRVLPLLTLALIGLLGTAGAAGALTPAPQALLPVPGGLLQPTQSAESAEGTEEFEEGEEECAEAESEEELVECEEEELSSNGLAPPEECVLQTARARFFAYGAQDRVRLVIAYTAVEPAEALVEYGLKGERGSLRLGAARQRLSDRGILHLGEHIGPGAMERVRAARSIVVQLHIPSAPDSCDRYFSRHLTVRRSIHSQLVWFQAGSVFGR